MLHHRTIKLAACTVVNRHARGCGREDYCQDYRVYKTASANPLLRSRVRPNCSANPLNPIFPQCIRDLTQAAPPILARWKLQRRSVPKAQSRMDASKSTTHLLK